MAPNKLLIIAYNANIDKGNVPEIVYNEVKTIANKVRDKGLSNAWRKNKKPLKEQITIRDGNLMTQNAMRKQLRKYYEGVNNDHHFYYPGVLTFIINLKNTREKNYTDGFPVPLIQNHEEVDEFFRGIYIDYERLINDTINEMTKDELIKFYNNVFFHDEMLWSEIPKEDDRHIMNPRYFNLGVAPIPRFDADGVIAAKKSKRKLKDKLKDKLKINKKGTKKQK